MFDIGFTELILIAIVGLVVIGPEQLPETIRTLSAWLNKIRRSYNDIRLEVQQELHNDSVLKELRDTGERIKYESEEIQSTLEKKYQGLGNEMSNHPSVGTTSTATDSIKDDN